MFQRKKPLSSLLQPYEILSIELPKGFPIKSEGFLLGGYSPQLDLIYLKNVDTPEISEIKEKYGCDDESFSTYIHLHEVEHRSLSGYRLGVILWILQWELLFTFQEALEITPRSIKCVEKLTEMTKLMLRYEKMIALLMKDARVLYEASALFNLQSIFDDNRLYKSIIEYQPTEIKQALKKLKWIYSYGETLPNTVLEIALNIPNPDFTKSMTASQFTLRYGALKRFNQLCHILKNKKIMEESDLVKEARKSKLLVKNKDEFIFPKNEIHDSLIFKRKIKLGEIAELYPPFVDRDDLSEIYLSPDIFYRQALPKKCQASNSTHS